MIEKWWKKKHFEDWQYNIDPYGELRVANGNARYIYSAPSKLHAEFLEAKGWIKSSGNPDYYTTDNPEIIKDSLSILGLPTLDYNKNYCMKVYWHEPMWYI